MEYDDPSSLAEEPDKTSSVKSVYPLIKKKDVREIREQHPNTLTKALRKPEV